MGAGRRVCRTRPPSRRFAGPHRWPSYDAAVSISGELQRARQLALAAKEEAAKELLLSLGPEIERQDRDDLALEVFAQLGEIYLNRTAYDGTQECVRRIEDCLAKYSKNSSGSEVEHMIAHYSLRAHFLRVGLAAAAHRRIGAYSKGMRQRLGLAQALIGAPDILFLDEPTTGLDPGLRRGFYEILGQLRDRGVTVLLSSHALSELQGNVDRVLVLNRGSLIADGSLSALRDLAHLPVRISVRAAHSLAELGPDWQKLGEGCAARLCEFGDKLTVLKTLLPQLDPADTLEIDEPSLDDLYAHFLGEEAGQ